MLGLQLWNRITYSSFVEDPRRPARRTYTEAEHRHLRPCLAQHHRYSMPYAAHISKEARRAQCDSLIAVRQTGSCGGLKALVVRC